jgi:hypothetical protein
MYVSLLSPCILLILTTNVEMNNQLHFLSLKLQWLWNVCNNWVTLATEGFKLLDFIYGREATGDGKFLGFCGVLRLNFGEWPVPDVSQKKQRWRLICCVDVCRECRRDMFLWWVTIETRVLILISGRQHFTASTFYLCASSMVIFCMLLRTGCQAINCWHSSLPYMQGHSLVQRWSALEASVR